MHLRQELKFAEYPKGEFFIKSLLYQRIEISVGKYKSDRLALELKKLREAFESAECETSNIMRVQGTFETIAGDYG